MLASAQSSVFRKYAPAIAHDVGMSLDTEQDYVDLFDAVPHLALSFRRTLDVARMGRWFSWNTCAHQQLREFWVAKMILAQHLDGSVVDPDEAAVGFDDLEGAARAKTPQAELAALKAANGGFKLAFKLMSSGLYEHAEILLQNHGAPLGVVLERGQRSQTSEAGLEACPCCSAGQMVSSSAFVQVSTQRI